MGIKNFYNFVKKFAGTSIEEIDISHMYGKTIGIDFNLMIYKLIMSIRAIGYDIRNGNIITTHIHSLLLKLTFFKKHNINAIFVFDGKAPIIKNNTLKERKKTREKMQQKYEKATTVDEKKRYYYLKKDISERELNDCKMLIKIFGFPVINAPQEADAQLAYMSETGGIDYIISDDADILLFGGNNIVKNFTINIKKKMPCIHLDILKNELEINQKSLIKLGIMLGSDYCGNPHISIGRAFKIIKGIEMYHDVDRECKDAIKYFCQPLVNTEYKKMVRFYDINENALVDYLYNFDYSDAQIDKIIDKLN